MVKRKLEIRISRLSSRVMGLICCQSAVHRGDDLNLNDLNLTDSCDKSISNFVYRLIYRYSFLTILFVLIQPMIIVLFHLISSASTTLTEPNSSPFQKPYGSPST